MSGVPLSDGVTESDAVTVPTSLTSSDREVTRLRGRDDADDLALRLARTVQELPARARRRIRKSFDLPADCLAESISDLTIARACGLVSALEAVHARPDPNVVNRKASGRCRR